MLLPISTHQRPFDLLNILDQVLNRTDLNPPLLSKLQTRISAHHPIIPADLRHALRRLTLLDQFCNHPRQRFPSKPAQLDCRLSMSGAFAHTTGPGSQRDNMARSPEVLEASSRRCQRTTGKSAILCGDPSRHGRIAGVDGDSVGRAFGVRVMGDHLWEGEVFCDRGRDGRADESAGIILISIDCCFCAGCLVAWLLVGF